MLEVSSQRRIVDEQTIELIAQRVITAIRDDLDAIAAELSTSPQATEQLSVGQVAPRLGVARSTVYAHWREWGGYKLGPGEKAPIRFDATALNVSLGGVRARERPRRLPVRRDLIRVVPPLDARVERRREA